MDVTRRGFLTGMLAVGAIAALPKLDWAGVPTLYGDMVNDDTEALQALLDHKPIIRDGQLFKPDPYGAIDLRGGHYLISDTLHLREDGTTIRDGFIKMVAEPKSGVAFEVRGGVKDMGLYRMHIEFAEVGIRLGHSGYATQWAIT